jgi:hypothetical protein
MTRYQHAKRIALWRGSFTALAAATFWMLASAYAGHITG